MKLASSSARRGFTLIELLVVIAIIGILSSVVLASLNTARNKGADAATKSSLANARAQSEIFYDDQTPISYAFICNAATGISPMLNSAANSSGTTVNITLATPGAATLTTCHVNAAGTQWVASSPLRSTAGYWCVDSTGTSTQKVNPVVGGAVACPAS